MSISISSIIDDFVNYSKSKKKKKTIEKDWHFESYDPDI